VIAILSGQNMPENYLTAFLASVFMHLAQAKIFSPEGKVKDCRLGFCFRLQVGLYFVALSLTLRQTIFPRFPQILHSFDISFFRLLMA